MTAPAHAKEHDALMVMLAKQIETSKLIEGAVLVTIGYDGRPCVGANIGNPAHVLQLLRSLGEAEDLVENVTKVDVPETN